MTKQTLLKALIIAMLIYYLMKGILYLLLHQILVKMEERGKERAEKHRKIIEERRKNRKW